MYFLRREAIKVAILFVGAGQDTESDILKNERGSDLYREFVSSLGWEVCLFEFMHE